MIGIKKPIIMHSFMYQGIAMDKKLIEEFEKDEGIRIQDVKMFGSYKRHKLRFLTKFKNHSFYSYIESIDDIILENPILIIKSDKDGNRFNYKNEKISDGNNTKPTDANISHWLYSKIHDRGCSECTEEGCTTYVGKWLIFVSPEHINNIWEKVKNATDNRLLGISSKVSTKFHTEEYGEKSYVICVYTKDFRDKDDVNNVLQGLRKIGINGKLYYKPDSMTLAGLYSKEGPLTKKKVKSSLYCSTDFENENYPILTIPHIV